METESKMVSFGEMKMPVFTKSKMTNERQTVVKQFVDAINLEQLAAKKKPYAASMIAFKLSHVKSLHDLYTFLSTCKDYRNRKGSFNKCFFGALKVQKNVA